MIIDAPTTVIVTTAKTAVVMDMTIAIPSTITLLVKTLIPQMSKRVPSVNQIASAPHAVKLSAVRR